MKRTPFIRADELLIIKCHWDDGDRTIGETHFGKEYTIDEVIEEVTNHRFASEIFRIEGNKAEDVTEELAEYYCSKAECREDIADQPWVSDQRDELPSEEDWVAIPHPNDEHRLTASDYGIGRV